VPLLELAGMLSEFDVGPLTLTRFASPVRNKFGEYAQGATSAIELSPVAAYQTTPDEAENMPEGLRTDDAKTTFIADVLLQTTDEIDYQGGTWRILFVINHDLQAGVYRAIGVREE